MLILFTTAACGRQEPPAPVPASSALEQASRVVSAKGACATLIPQEWSPSFAVPSMTGGSLRFRVFFFGYARAADRSLVFHAPQGEASFTLDGRVLECRALPGAPRAIPRDARFDSLTLEELTSRASRLHADVEAIATLFASGRDIGETGRARVAAFSRDFAALADPSHAAAYRALAPDFWAWAEKNGGAAPAPAK
ncbi:MAG: hypothetical protein Q8T11_01860 [Elusimicrobiota bacterium]|nr:hypothetical protein [Elusimicrobiota bacterium]